MNLRESDCGFLVDSLLSGGAGGREFSPFTLPYTLWATLWMRSEVLKFMGEVM